MEKLEQIRYLRRKAHARLKELRSPVYESFLAMEKAAYAGGALPVKTKELIAVGISVATDCESCMEWHIRQAGQAGATHQEILEAIDVGMELPAGRATVAARFALEVMEEVFPRGA